MVARKSLADRPLGLSQAVLRGGPPLIALLMACSHSTHYRPLGRNRIYLSVIDGKYAFSKNDATAILRLSVNRELLAMTSCSDVARQHAEKGQDNIDTASVWFFVASIGGAGLIFPVILYEKYRDDGMARFVDAMNRHNDVPSCGTRNTTATQPSSSGGTR